MDLTGMQIFWALLVLAALIGFGVLIARQMKSQREFGPPIDSKPDSESPPPVETGDVHPKQRI